LSRANNTRLKGAFDQPGTFGELQLLDQDGQITRTALRRVDGLPVRLQHCAPSALGTHLARQVVIWVRQATCLFQQKEYAE
jgi:hypothetical protein